MRDPRNEAAPIRNWYQIGLPDPILLKIFSYIEKRATFIVVSKVCETWRRVANDRFLLRYLNNKWEKIVHREVLFLVDTFLSRSLSHYYFISASLTTMTTYKKEEIEMPKSKEEVHSRIETMEAAIRIEQMVDVYREFLIDKKIIPAGRRKSLYYFALYFSGFGHETHPTRDPLYYQMLRCAAERFLEKHIENTATSLFVVSSDGILSLRQHNYPRDEIASREQKRDRVVEDYVPEEKQCWQVAIYTPPSRSDTQYYEESEHDSAKYEAIASSERRRRRVDEYYIPPARPNTRLSTEVGTKSLDGHTTSQGVGNTSLGSRSCP